MAGRLAGIGRGASTTTRPAGTLIAASAAASIDNASASATTSHKLLRVLCVDDEATIRNLMRRMLERVGCTVELLSDGSQVVDHLVAIGQLPPQSGSAVAVARAGTSQSSHSAQPYDCIFLDIVMRWSSGDDVCRDLRARGLSIPIIAATGNSDSRQELLAAGFTTILSKPFQITAIREALVALHLLDRA